MAAQQTTIICRELIDQMNETAKGWKDDIQRTYYNRRLYPMVETASKYQSDVDSYMHLLDEYEHRIADLAGITARGTGFGEYEHFRKNLDPRIFAEWRNKNR